MKHLLPAAFLTVFLAACDSTHSHHSDYSNQANAAKIVIAAMDTNRDGQISWQENSFYFDRLFNQLDIGHKGYVTQAEFSAINNDPIFKAMPLQKLEISFQMFDVNNDGKLTHDEFEHMGDRVFALLDRNMDGFVSESDFTPQQSCGANSGGHGRRSMF